MRARLVAFLLSAILIFYFVVIFQRALLMTRDERGAFLLLGIGVFLIVAVGLWALWREINIGSSSQKLAKRLTAEGGMPEASIPFEICKRDVEENPEDWRAWYRLAVAYGEAGDTRNGRASLRKAWDLSKH